MQRAIPANIISGFLGVGKTTMIRRLLESKPAKERWAVLVNEFGEVGIDGALLQSEGVSVREVPGGCMCCSVGLPSRTALNELISEQKPDRILIEPTGLAHPIQVNNMFSGADYAGLLDMRATIGLVDPWCLGNEAFRQMPAFEEQLQMADVLVATKADVAETTDVEAFFSYAAMLQPEKVKVGAVSHGEMPWQWLDLPQLKRDAAVQVSSGHGHDHAGHEADEEALQTDAEGIQQLQSQTEYAHSCGWIFPAGQQFSLQALVALAEALDIPRIKGVFSTSDGWQGVNKMRVTLSTQALEQGPEDQQSRVEMISTEPVDWAAVAVRLKACRIAG